LPILYSTMIRSESISSSWIEGIRETPRAIALAQINDKAASHDATSVIRNVDAMRDAIELLGGGAWTHAQVLDIHHDLLPWHRYGYRSD
ncbi:Fic/DOC family N-terminal domain-containing protein, partial [Salmonella enterica]|uniref:Fic/DOC family N-terminal domain-containing protein n=1 Tax=Salmonella enterica TaxID=28901 RepID=UPI0032995892